MPIHLPLRGSDTNVFVALRGRLGRVCAAVTHLFLCHGALIRCGLYGVACRCDIGDLEGSDGCDTCFVVAPRDDLMWAAWEVGVAFADVVGVAGSGNVYWRRLLQRLHDRRPFPWIVRAPSPGDILFIEEASHHLSALLGQRGAGYRPGVAFFAFPRGASARPKLFGDGCS